MPRPPLDRFNPVVRSKTAQPCRAVPWTTVFSFWSIALLWLLSDSNRSNFYVMSTCLSTARSVQSKGSTAARPSPSGDRVIGLPSTTSTGLWAVRDDVRESNYPDHAPVSVPADSSFMDNIELGTLKEMVEDMQLKIATLEDQKADALASRVTADSKVMTLEAELRRCQAASANHVVQMERERSALQAVIDEQAAEIDQGRSNLVNLEHQLQRERTEVQRATNHAREAGRAADEALATLTAERRAAEQAQQTLGSNVEQAMAEREEALRRDVTRLANQVAGLEEDVITEKEWREAAQKEAKDASARSEGLKKQAKAAATAAELAGKKAATHAQELAKLREQVETAESSKSALETARKERARKQARDEQSAQFRARTSEKARTAVLEAEVAKLTSALEDATAVSAALRQEKAERSKLAAYNKELAKVLLGAGIPVPPPTSGGKSCGSAAAARAEKVPAAASQGLPAPVAKPSPGNRNQSSQLGRSNAPPIYPTSQRSTKAGQEGGKTSRSSGSPSAVGANGQASSNLGSDKQPQPKAVRAAAAGAKANLRKPLSEKEANSKDKQSTHQSGSNLRANASQPRRQRTTANDDDDDDDFDDDDDEDDSYAPYNEDSLDLGLGNANDDDDGEGPMNHGGMARQPLPARKQVASLKAARPLVHALSHNDDDTGDVPAWMLD